MAWTSALPSPVKSKRDGVVAALVIETVAVVAVVDTVVTRTAPLDEMKVLFGCSVASASPDVVPGGVGSSTTVAPVAGLKRSTRTPRVSPYTLAVSGAVALRYST